MSDYAIRPVRRRNKRPCHELFQRRLRQTRRVWAGHGMERSTEDPATWESSHLRALLTVDDKRVRTLAYGILVNRRGRR